MGGGTSKPDPKQEEQALLSKFIEYIKSDDYKEFEKLLELHPTILNVQDNDGQTLAMWASDRGRPKVLKVLMAKKPDINIKNNEGKTCMDQIGGWGDEPEEVMMLLMGAGAQKPMKEYTVEDVAKHNNKMDAWIIIDGIVVDVTDYMERHPGGETILQQCAGKDVSKEFNEPGRHSAAAGARMKAIGIGNIVAAASS